MTLSIEAFHGTSLQSATDIRADNYNESNKDDDWLGRGIYFFVDGVSDPLENAIEWAKNQAYDKDTRTLKYTRLAVLKSIVEIKKVDLLDLTSLEGLREFNDLKSQLVSRIYKDFTSAQLRKMSGGEHNCALFNYMVATFKARAVKHNLYIKNKEERKLNLKLNVPNSTVLCVRKAKFKFNAEVVHEGVVK